MKKINSRLTHSVIDELGIDPLRDKSFDVIQSIVPHSTYKVNEHEEFNLPLIAYNAYGDKNLWWVIQIYSGIADPFEVKKGTLLKVPSYSELITALSESTRNEEEITIVEI